MWRFLYDKSTEDIYKMHDCFTSYDCIQIMLGSENYALLFGNNNLMYYNNLIENNGIQQFQKTKNIFLFRTGMFVNQILEYDKPYIQISDKYLIKKVAYKENGTAFIYSDILNNQKITNRTIIVSRRELQQYFHTGILKDYDNNIYNNKYIISSSGKVLSDNLILEQFEQKLIDFEKNSYRYY